MNLQEILEHRRAVRYYDASKPIDADRVEACVRLPFEEQYHRL